MPESAVDATAALNRLVGSLHESWLFRPGVMVTGAVDLAAGPLWASAPDELLPSWLATSIPAPFEQIHGHSSTVDWATGRHYGRPELAPIVTEDPESRHATAVIEDRRIVGVDPGHQRRPAPRWAPLVLEDAVVVAGADP